MLKKRERLSRAEFQKTYTTGRRFGTSTITCTATPSDLPKCAVVVSKKTANNATARNTLRRRTYAALEATRPLWLKKNIILFLSKKTAHLEYPRLLEELTELLEKTNPER